MQQRTSRLESTPSLTGWSSDIKPRRPNTITSMRLATFDASNCIIKTLSLMLENCLKQTSKRVLFWRQCRPCALQRHTYEIKGFALQTLIIKMAPGLDLENALNWSVCTCNRCGCLQPLVRLHPCTVRSKYGKWF